jgi:hypothetical protein
MQKPPFAKAIMLRTTRVPFPGDEYLFIHKGVQRANPPRTTIVEALRSLMPEYRDVLLATSEELQVCIPHDLPCILELTKWMHPDVAEDELPSNTQSFQMLVQVLITGDTSHYDLSNEI